LKEVDQVRQRFDDENAAWHLKRVASKNFVELLGRYSNPDIVSRLRQVLADQKPERLPDRTTRSLPKKQTQHRLEPQEVDQLVEHYRAGTKIVDLAIEFQISRTTVMKHVERAGEPTRNLIRDHLDEARRLYDDDGWSLARIGRHLGVNASTVWQAFRNAGVPMRDTRGR
jgi:DNA-directed RNA polymerase specialized sigma24 family protein